MNKIRKGDTVIVIAGKDKGKIGEVKRVLIEGDKVIVEGINMVKKCVRQDPNKGIKGGIEPKEMPLHRCKVMIYDPIAKKRSRVKIETLKDGQKARFYKASGEEIVKG